MLWFRLDNRLVHGQIIEGWLPYLDARELVVVNDCLAVNHIHQEIMRLAIPGRIQVHFVPIAGVRLVYERIVTDDVPCLFLFADCKDAARLVAEEGIAIPVLNIGNMHYAKGKLQLCAHVAASDEDLHCMRFLRDKGTRFDFRSVPGDDSKVEGW
ncbi:PTS sugar transporter subunit IIB [Desulfovibrio sp. OttesenSCG-928-A18]|nr:PTS sugar transporter subunit IIB [Desulfovibrio sp. OttesenSCG-928-A18]